MATKSRCIGAGRLLRASVLLLFVCCASYAADACDATGIYGPYGFQLSGTTTIGGPAQPVAVVGRLVLDGKGAISGVSSVNFNGYFLGNPTTGKYEVKEDCSVNFSLQDTSGGYQNFTGKAVTGGASIDIQQSDPGTHERGQMLRSLDTCAASSFQGQYRFTLSGHSTPFATDGVKGPPSARAVVQADGNGNLVVQRGDAKTSGTFTVGSDCFVDLQFGLADGDSSSLIKLRGILVNGGKEMMAVESDPEQVGSARFSQ
ncbi:MAG TPA: hypothetical protein VKU19_41260 [Bryobacteraceae bacterium]|nr:hypothetical protein [Bryobacteraceae bacterium]